MARQRKLRQTHPTVLVAADILLTLLHVAVILANLLLWIFPRARRAHVAIVGSTALSWFVLGPWMGRGLGYCVLTDWHWQVKRALGQRQLPGSFVTYMFQWIGVDARSWVTELTLGLFLLAVGLALAHVIRELRARRTRQA